LASDRPPNYKRAVVPTAFTPFEPLVLATARHDAELAGHGARGAGRLDRVDQLVP
jgi:hypothetical protein